MTTILFISKNEKKVVGKVKNKINIIETLYNINKKSGDLVSELNPHSLIISTETLLKKTTLIDFLTQVSRQNNKLKIIVVGATDNISDTINIEQYENWTEFLGNSPILKNKGDDIEIQIINTNQKNLSTKSIISLVSITTVCALLCFIAIFVAQNSSPTDNIVYEISSQVIESSSDSPNNTTTSISESQNTDHTSHEVSKFETVSSELQNSENEPISSQISDIEPTSSELTESHTTSENSKPASKPSEPITSSPQPTTSSKPEQPTSKLSEPATSSSQPITSSKPANSSEPTLNSQIIDTKIYLSTNELTLKVGETKNIYAYNSEYGIKVSNTNKAVASININDISSITVTANAAGTVTLTFTSKYDSSTAICKVYVLPNE